MRAYVQQATLTVPRGHDARIEPNAGQIRIAVVSTPRSGNTWLRGLLADSIGGHEIAVHSPREVPWDELPERAVLQLHWSASAPFEQLLTNHAFKVVTICRHPLDVLISILHFSRFEPATARWLDGAGGDESALLSARPTDDAVVQYATSDRFQRLLALSVEWQRKADASVRYEDLVADPLASISEVFADLRIDVGLEQIVDAIGARRFERMRPTAPNQHFWRGQADVWRGLLPLSSVDRMRPSLDPALTGLGYIVDPDVNLGAAEANLSWASM